jgi:hypothetical protein
MPLLMRRAATVCKGRSSDRAKALGLVYEAKIISAIKNNIVGGFQFSNLIILPLTESVFLAEEAFGA